MFSILLGHWPIVRSGIDNLGMYPYTAKTLYEYKLEAGYPESVFLMVNVLVCNDRHSLDIQRIPY